jgi:hypothetical protein
VKHILLWWVSPERIFYYFLTRIMRACLLPVLYIALVIVVKRCILGK